MTNRKTTLKTHGGSDRGRRYSEHPQGRRWATVRETADYLDVTDRTIRQMISDGRLRAYRSGARLVRVDLNELDAAMQPFGGDAA